MTDWADKQAYLAATSALKAPYANVRRVELYVRKLELYVRKLELRIELLEGEVVDLTLRNDVLTEAIAEVRSESK